MSSRTLKMVHATADRNLKEILLNFPSSEGGQNSNPGQQISVKLDRCGPRYFGETGNISEKPEQEPIKIDGSSAPPKIP